jgi:hypothetical protein
MLVHDRTWTPMRQYRRNSIGCPYNIPRLQGTVRGGLFDLEATPKRKPLYQTIGYQKPGDGCPPRLCYCDVSQFGI